MLLCSITDPRPTLENGREGVSFDNEIYNFLKATRLMRLRAAPPSTRTWYNLMLAMVGETSSGSCPAPIMFLGQSEASKLIDVSIHLWWGATQDVGAAATTAQCYGAWSCAPAIVHHRHRCQMLDKGACRHVGHDPYPLS
jgi:hypothetical protein